MSSKNIDIKISEDLVPYLYILKGGETVSDKLTLSAVVGLFTTKVITLEKAAELTGKSIWDFIDILKVYGIPWGEYEEDDMDMDDVFLSKLGEIMDEKNWHYMQYQSYYRFDFDRLYLLWDLFGSIIIPEAVFNELCADSVNHQDEIKRIKECVNSGKIIIYKVKNADTVKALYGRLHFGELEVIVGAKELGIDFAIIDEHAARKMASEFLIDTIGVLGILSLAKTKGLINLVKPEMDKLISKGYRISDKLYNQILARNNEVN